MSESALTTQQITPMELLQNATQSGASIEQLTQLMGLQERWEANEARKAYNVAFSAFKAESVRIVKNVSVTDGPLKGKKYANLFGVVDAVVPLLSKHGLSHSWRMTKDDPQWMEVTCTIKHILGHFESVSMGAAPDDGPGRNKIQGRMSANSYLERYTLLAATGLAATDTDDDGNGATGEEMPLDAFANWQERIEMAPDKQTLFDVHAAAHKQATEIGDKNAVRAFLATKNKRKAEL